MEAFKFAYAQRIEYLGDPAFNATVDEVRFNLIVIG